MRFIEHVLNVLIEPAHLLQVRVERRQERVEMRFGARIVGAQIFAPNFAIFDNERRNPEWRIVTRRAVEQVATFDDFRGTRLTKDLDPAVEPREIVRERSASHARIGQ